MDKIKNDIKGEKLLCPIKHMLNIVGGKWKLSILCILSSEENVRYNILKRKLNGITNMMLTQSLKELEYFKMVNRVQYNEVPPRVEYSLTQKGKSVIPILIDMAKWGIKNMNDNEEYKALCNQCRKTN